MSVIQARSLRHTVIATLLIGFALLTAVQYFATAYFVSRKVSHIEAVDGFAKLRRLHHAIDHAEEDLDRTAADWAVWDETYLFALGTNADFVEENLTLETFRRLHLNLLAVVKDDGSILYAQALRPDGRALEPVDRELMQTARKATRDASGFLPSSFGPILISSRAIQDSEEKQFSDARLFMGRALGSLAPGIAQITSVPLATKPLTALHTQGHEQPFFRDREALYLTPETVEGYSPIDDVNGKPLALLHITQQRSLQPGLARALRVLLGVTLLVGIGFAVAGLIVLRARVVRPIERLVTAVEAIGTDPANVQRLDENHREREFVALSRAINTMVAQIEAQQSLRADRDAAIEANRLKSDFLATMSHEIRTPMNGVLGMCELLQRTQLDSRQRHLSDMLLRSARSLLGILNDILDFSKIESGKLNLEAAPFSPQELIANASAPFAASAQSKGLDFSVRVDAAVPLMVIGDPLRLRQVLNNLLSNAVKFTKQGSIAVTCSVDHCDSKDLTLRVVVKDTGIGIEPDALPRIFDAFAQAESSTTRRFGGTGLGLAIVRRIVELMGGEVGVQSDGRRGSSFWFTFKLQRTSAPESLVLSAAIDATGPRFSTQSAPKVLLAEDNAVNREVLTEMLEVIGCRVATAENGAQAVALGAEQSFDAILMDCQMPVMDGPTAATELRALERASSRSPTVIVALTADATTENRERCLEAGMDAVLTKPISQARLRELILQAMQAKKTQASIASAAAV